MSAIFRVAAFLYLAICTSAFAQSYQQFNQYILSLPQASALSGSESIPVIQNGLSRQMSGFNYMALQNSNNVYITGGSISGVSLAGPNLTLSQNSVSNSAAVQQFLASQNISGSVTSGQALMNEIAINSDSLNTTNMGGPGGADYLYVGGTMNSSSLTGNRTAIVGFLNMTATTGNGPAGGKFYTGIASQANASANDSGTSSVGAGNLFGSNFVANLESGATYFQGLVGSEIDVACQSGCEKVFFKTGLKVVQLAADAVQGADADYAIGINNQANGTAPGWNVGIAFGAPEGWWPITTGGTLIGTYTANISGGPSIAAANGIDFAAVSFSGNAFASPNFTIAGSGAVSIGDGQSLTFSNTNLSSRTQVINTEGFDLIFNSIGGGQFNFQQGGATIAQIGGTLASGVALINGSATVGGTFGGEGSVDDVDIEGAAGPVMYVPHNTTTAAFQGAMSAILPSSAGSGGVYVCVDSDGNFYKKSSCP